MNPVIRHLRRKDILVIHDVRAQRRIGELLREQPVDEILAAVRDAQDAPDAVRGENLLQPSFGFSDSEVG